MPSLRILATLICGSIALAGCKSEPKEYPFDVAEAVRRLDNSDSGGFRYARHCGVLFNFGSVKTDDHTVTWTARANRKDVLTFNVVVTESPKGVTLKLSVPLESNGREKYDGTQNYSHPILKQPIRPAIAELIESAMEKRSFDNERVEEAARYLDRSPSGGACSEDAQYLAQGFAANYDDPPGLSIETARKLAAKNNWN
ncbi:hypothetical protein [Bradyrhizobium acaciae]|uniref:hypothetical protein n=1 Tax=Bradyrhizobium acaciae TaxID=2683706 RepID=UPI001E481774|nr:hypothetical protein [Bradyrhizobium acaciae]MCC8982995.1 hypothetical protein [Bradyrhizobium acaciae]